jgi:hypothetical protein
MVPFAYSTPLTGKMDDALARLNKEDRGNVAKHKAMNSTPSVTNVKNFISFTNQTSTVTVTL